MTLANVPFLIDKRCAPAARSVGKAKRILKVLFTSKETKNRLSGQW